MNITGPWICDACKETVSKQDAVVLWLQRTVDSKTVGRDLMLVHRLRSESGQGCYPHLPSEFRRDGSCPADMFLNATSDPDALVRLLALQESGEFAAPPVNRMIMRLFIPGYESARPFFALSPQRVVEPHLPPDYYYEHQLEVFNKLRLEACRDQGRRQVKRSSSRI